jgi:hypothetical protein
MGTWSGGVAANATFYERVRELLISVESLELEVVSDLGGTTCCSNPTLIKGCGQTVFDGDLVGDVGEAGHSPYDVQYCSRVVCISACLISGVRMRLRVTKNK